MSTQQNPYSASERLQILSPDEYEQVWGIPRFTANDRAVFFAVGPREMALIQRLRTPRTKAHLLLLIGYFRARQRIFSLHTLASVDPITEDLAYLQQAHLDGAEVVDLAISKHTRQLHVQWVLTLFGYHLLDVEGRGQLETRALRAARISSRPLYVLRDLLSYLQRQRIALPGYSLLQDTVRRALSVERKRLSGALVDAMTTDDIALLGTLLSDDSGVHTLTTLKHQPRDFSHQQLLIELARGEQLRPLFEASKRIIQEAELTAESVRFYASLVDYYTVYKLKRMSASIVQLYLLCFVHDRYQRLNDHLLDAWCTLTRRYGEEARALAREAMAKHRLQVVDDMDKAAGILQLFLDPDVPGNQPFAEVRSQALKLLPQERLSRLCQHLVHDAKVDALSYEWAALDSLMAKIKRNLRPLVVFLELTGTTSQQTLLSAFTHVSNALRDKQTIPSDLPLSWLPERHKPYVFQDGVMNSNRVEYCLYRQLRERLEAGDIHCAQSTRFRSFEEDLVDKETLGIKHELLPQLGLVDAKIPIKQRLDGLRQTLTKRHAEVNDRILRGDNPFVQAKDGKLCWSNGNETETIADQERLFDVADRIDIDQLLLQVDRHTHFLKAFEHVTGRYQREKAKTSHTIAALVAFATNMGLGRMAEISNIDRDQLRSTAANFIRLETLKEANDRLASATARLPIFKLYDIDGVVHSSSDGQKFETAIPTANARHSSKYFGLKKGVVAYTLLASHVPINARIIGANEHESHYVYDVLFNNHSDIKPEIHSTDTHGTNQVNFALLHLFGYRFAPRYRNFKERIKTGLYSFEHPKHVEGPLKPVRKLSESLIADEWDNIESILLSLALKTTSQSVLVSKLATHRRQNRTKKALWEFEHIIRSLYLLDYVDDASLRRNVHRALNRGEAYHRMRKAIAYAHGGRFRVRSQQEQELWNECARLLANAVVHYNGMLLSAVLKELEKKGNKRAIEVLSRISPLSWQHINFYGRYRFDGDLKPLDLLRMAEALTGSNEHLWRQTG